MPYRWRKQINVAVPSREGLQSVLVSRAQTAKANVPAFATVPVVAIAAKPALGIVNADPVHHPRQYNPYVAPVRQVALRVAPVAVSAPGTIVRLTFLAPPLFCGA